MWHKDDAGSFQGHVERQAWKLCLEMYPRWNMVRLEQGTLLRTDLVQPIYDLAIKRNEELRRNASWSPNRGSIAPKVLPPPAGGRLVQQVESENRGLVLIMFEDSAPRLHQQPLPAVLVQVEISQSFCENPGMS